MKGRFFYDELSLGGDDFGGNLVGGISWKSGAGDDGGFGRGGRSGVLRDYDAGGDGILERNFGNSTEFRAGGLAEQKDEAGVKVFIP